MGRLCKRPDTAEKPAGMVTICEIGAMSSEFLSIRLNSVDAVHRLNDDGRDELSCLRYSRFHWATNVNRRNLIKGNRGWARVY